MDAHLAELLLELVERVRVPSMHGPKFNRLKPETGDVEVRRPYTGGPKDGEAEMAKWAFSSPKEKPKDAPAFEASQRRIYYYLTVGAGKEDGKEWVQFGKTQTGNSCTIDRLPEDTMVDFVLRVERALTEQLPDIRIDPPPPSPPMATVDF